MDHAHVGISNLLMEKFPIAIDLDHIAINQVRTQVCLKVWKCKSKSTGERFAKRHMTRKCKQ